MTSHHDSFCILDCFVDEPACFGVPPFMAPYPRYIYGALIDAGVPPERIEYRTIDSLRANGYRLAGSFSRVFLVGGAVVPGKYLGRKIGTVAEIERILGNNRDVPFAIGGLISRVMPDRHENARLVLGDIERYAWSAARGEEADEPRTIDQINRWSVAGAPVVRQHPDYPLLICEIETGRGCPRQAHCSFCSEGLIPGIENREPAAVLAEVDALIGRGIGRFRIGRQADILQYGTTFADFRGGFPRPAQEALATLFGGLRERRAAGAITLLNIDNANPGTIAQFPEESARLLEILSASVTPGDTLALGIESFDPEVVRRNNLKVDAEEAIRVVRLINEIGGTRVDGIPALLPGINLLHGLRGETMETFSRNFEALARIRDEGLLVKRINIRQVLPFPGTPLALEPAPVSKKTTLRFEYYRDRIRDEIDGAMLERIYPAGTVIREILIQENRAGYSYGRQLASYAITLKFPMELPLSGFLDAVVIGHRERSLVALPLPVAINTLPANALAQIPGIGKKRASEIVMRRPFADIGGAAAFLSDVPGAVRRVLGV